ncbi:YqaA family protein [Bdellovibrio sp. HCB337]|uniref:YqaA family protein n=1 Tax=Bdellovibrio sp. HCB337 TaxID=3394358 RepID=UPI0039A7656B
MTIAQRFHEKTRAHVKTLQGFVDRYWYPPFIGFLAALDNLIVVIPNDGILISSTMLIPKRWLILALSVAVGSTFGAIALSLIVEHQGLPLILKIYPGIADTSSWNLTLEFFEKYGLLLVFVVAVTPFVQQPAVILASLAKTPLFELAVVIFIGRLIKFLIMAYIASHAPRLLKKMWGIKDELNDTGVKLE